MHNNPLVSVILPCYNHEKYVGEAIESVLNQTYSNIELIVLDNGSTDNSYEVIKQYESQVKKIIRFEKNIILREKFAGECNGKYISTMTSDDVWEPTKIQKQVEILEANKSVKACFSWIWTADEELNILQEDNTFKQPNRNRFEWLEKFLLEGNCVAYPTALIHKDIYFDAWHKLKPYHQIPDLAMWISILLKHEIYVIQEPLAKFRWHKKGNNRNVSSATVDNTIRTMNENAMMVMDTLIRMDNETFINTFGKYFRDANSTTDIELDCEKFFLLMMLAEKRVHYEQQVIYFYYLVNKCNENGRFEMLETLENKYQFTKEDFRAYCGTHGMGEMTRLYHEHQTYRKISIHYNAMKNTFCLKEEDEQRKRKYRQSVFKQLMDDRRKMMNIMVSYVEELFDFIEKADDGCMMNEYPQLLQQVKQYSNIMRILWEEVIQFDIEANEEKWNEFCENCSKDEIDIEEFCDKILPYLIEQYLIIKQYISE